VDETKWAGFAVNVQRDDWKPSNPTWGSRVSRRKWWFSFDACAVPVNNWTLPPFHAQRVRIDASQLNLYSSAEFVGLADDQPSPRDSRVGTV
jgi:hypothetical protein